MSGARLSRTKSIEKYILSQVDDNTGKLPSLIAEHFEISRQAANRHLAKMVSKRLLTKEGATKNTKYKAVSLAVVEEQFAIAPGLHEDIVYTRMVAPLLVGELGNVRAIVQYGFTEMLNNAVDHSRGTSVYIKAELTSSSVNLYLRDNGVGVFRRITDGLGLADEAHAILELAKGKVTTDPKRHSGEGIFFTSRVFDDFTLLANQYAFLSGAGSDWLMERAQDEPGTVVLLKLFRYTDRKIEDVFQHFSTDPGAVNFDKTVLPVTLARVGSENLVSRSQAKRLLTRIEKFKEVILDFKDVPSIGQAFADEVFRVFVSAHPDVHLVVVNAIPVVEKMIERVKKSPGTI